MERITDIRVIAARLFEAFGSIDVLELLPKVTVPTIVFHCRGDALISFEDGRRIAAAIPGAKFVPLESNNHLLLQSDPSWKVFVNEVRRFIGREDKRSEQETQLFQGKTCPTCSRTYADESLSYCLDDGTLNHGLRLRAKLRRAPTESTPNT